MAITDTVAITKTELLELVRSAEGAAHRDQIKLSRWGQNNLTFPILPQERERMARVTVVSAAYYGDVMPFVPIALELVRRGHHVTYCVPRGFHAALTNQGLELADYGVDFSPSALEGYGQLHDRNDLRAAAASAPRGVRTGRPRRAGGRPPPAPTRRQPAQPRRAAQPA